MEILRQYTIESTNKAKESIEKRIPIKTKTFDEFLVAVDKQGASSVEAEVLFYTDYGSTGIPAGGFGLSGVVPIGVGFESRFRSITAKGRTIRHREYYGYREIDKHGPEADTAISHALITAERRLQQLEASVGVRTELFGPNGRIDEVQREGLRGIAEEETPSLVPTPDYLLIENKLQFNRIG